MALGYSAIGQSFGAAATLNGGDVSLIPGTHTYVAPNSSLAPPLEEVEGNWHESSAGPPIDAASWKSLGGVNIILICTMTCNALFCCLGRADFTLPIFIFGYYVWCVQSEWHPVALWRKSDGQMVKDVYAKTTALRYATAKTIRGVQLWTVLMIAVSVIDAFWIAMAFAAWTCLLHSRPLHPDTGEPIEPYDPLHCFDAKNHRTLISTYTLDLFVLRLSLLNLSLMVVSIVLAAVWVRQQKAATKTAKAISPP